MVLPQSPQLALATKRALVAAEVHRPAHLDGDDVVLLLPLAREAVGHGVEVVAALEDPLGEAEADRELEVVPRACAW